MLFSQPILSVERVPELGQVCELCHEVLVRLRGEHGDLVPPGAFIPAAERYHLMPKIDRWVVSATLRWLAANLQRPGIASHYSINLSGQSLSDEGFLGFVVEQLEATGVPGEKICFEITETAAVATLGHAMRCVSVLKQKGCRFSLDDFGSGWSSFAYLKSLAVDFLKIDGSFVKDMARNPLDLAIVSSVVQIGHAMGLQTIAEFVETVEILNRLHGAGVDYAQGYAIGKPRPIDEHLRRTAERGGTSPCS